MSNSVRLHRRQPTRLPRPWDSPGTNTGVGCYSLLQCMKVKSEREVAQSCQPSQPHGLQPSKLFRPWDFPGKNAVGCHCLLCIISLLLLLSCFSHARLCVTPETAAHQAPLSLGFSRQEHWSGLPFPSPMHESESESEVSESCPALSNPRDCSLPGSSGHGILQARVLAWVATRTYLFYNCQLVLFDHRHPLHPSFASGNHQFVLCIYEFVRFHISEIIFSSYRHLSL